MRLPVLKPFAIPIGGRMVGYHPAGPNSTVTPKMAKQFCLIEKGLAGPAQEGEGDAS